MDAKKFLNIFDLMNVGLWQYNAKSEEFSCNEKFLEIFSYPEFGRKFKSMIIDQLPSKKFTITYSIGNQDRFYECTVSNEDSLYSGSMTDITNKLEEEKELYNLAFFDPLTGLKNKISCMNYLDSIEGKGFYLYFDIYKFKSINDTFGHQIGDEVLIRFSRVLENRVSTLGEVFRLSGDEFFAHVNVTKFPIIKKIMNKINKDILDIDMPNIPTLKANIGIVKHKGNMNTEAILQKADLAMYVAKHSVDKNYVVADNDVMDRFIDEVEFNIRMNIIIQFGETEMENVVLRRTSRDTVVNSLVHLIYKNN